MLCSFRFDDFLDTKVFGDTQHESILPVVDSIFHNTFSGKLVRWIKMTSMRFVQNSLLFQTNNNIMIVMLCAKFLTLSRNLALCY